MTSGGDSSRVLDGKMRWQANAAAADATAQSNAQPPASGAGDVMERGRPPRDGQGGRPHATYAAVDLGTNNCRLLIARPSPDGFRVIDAFSKTVRLGAGIGATGRLSDSSMQLTIEALKVCAAKIRRRKANNVRAIATEACRVASNGRDFVARVERETGLKLEIITPEEEAYLAASGCAPLVDPACKLALVFDIGGGSTELIWLDLELLDRRTVAPPVIAWTSMPVGVVNLAESFPGDGRDGGVNYRRMVAHVADHLARFTEADHLKTAFAAGEAHLVGNSGTVTTLAGVLFKLERYDRTRIDGAWVNIKDLVELTATLDDLGNAGRASHPCIGSERADLLIPGCAILEAIHSAWPAARVRVADRGLREGILLQLMAEHTRGRPVRPRGTRPFWRAPASSH